MGVLKLGAMNVMLERMAYSSVNEALTIGLKVFAKMYMILWFVGGIVLCCREIDLNFFYCFPWEIKNFTYFIYCTRFWRNQDRIYY